MRMVDIIDTKRNGGVLSDEQLQFFVDGVVNVTIPDYQISALLMAIYFQDMTKEEQTSLTMKMMESGERLDLSRIPGIKVDKHSTGGVGDKVSLPLAAMVAATGIPVPMISGRGLGHTGGTLDKLEAIPGFRVELSEDEFINQVAKEKLATSVDTTITETYWQIGKYIVETEQDGKIKAAYGKKLLTTLSHELTLRLGKGYSRPNLNNMRKFYLKYPNCQMVSDKLSWSHICELIKLDDDLERSFYERQTVNENWSVRELQRQIDSALFLRLAVSRDKEGILSLAQRGIEVQKPEDVIKSTYTLEFLNLPESSQYTESDLEQTLIDNLQKFLLELGKGFTFVGRQYKITINNVHYHVHLVFYHRILKCFVLIDLKKDSARHEDIGQMNMYLGYFATEENMPDDNAPIGIIMSRNKDELLVEYATYGMDSNLFVSKYELYLPNREDLERLVSNILKDSSGES